MKVPSTSVQELGTGAVKAGSAEGGPNTTRLPLPLSRPKKITR